MVTTGKEASSAVVRLVEMSTEQAERLVDEATEDANRIREEANRTAHQVTTDARTRAERVESEARVNAERMQADALGRAEKLDREIEARRGEMFGDLEKQRDELTATVSALRAFEATYRSNLTNHLRSQIEALESGRAEPSDVPDVVRDLVRADGATATAPISGTDGTATAAPAERDEATTLGGGSPTSNTPAAGRAARRPALRPHRTPDHSHQGPPRAGPDACRDAQATIRSRNQRVIVEETSHLASKVSAILQCPSACERWESNDHREGERRRGVRNRERQSAYDDPQPPAKSAPAVHAVPVEHPDKPAEAGQRAVRCRYAPARIPGPRPSSNEVRTTLTEDIARFESQIEISTAELVGLLRDGSEGAGRDPADVGSANFERDAEMSLANNAREMLDQSRSSRCGTSSSAPTAAATTAASRSARDGCRRSRGRRCASPASSARNVDSRIGGFSRRRPRRRLRLLFAAVDGRRPDRSTSSPRSSPSTGSNRRARSGCSAAC